MSIHSEASNEEMHSKKGGKLMNDGSSDSITIERIQDLIANTIKAQLGGDACKIHLYAKHYNKRVDALCMLATINLQNSSIVMERVA